MECEQHIAISSHVSPPESQPQHVITHYIGGGRSQMWMTEPDKESDVDWWPWLTDDILSCHYEYPDEEDGVGSLNQGGTVTYEDANMDETNKNYRYDKGSSYSDGSWCWFSYSLSSCTLLQ